MFLSKKGIYFQKGLDGDVIKNYTAQQPDRALFLRHQIYMTTVEFRQGNSIFLVRFGAFCMMFPSSFSHWEHSVLQL